MNCNACGSTNLIEGKAVSAGDGSSHVFMPKDDSFLKRMLAIGGRKIHAYGCLRCSNLQFTVDFREEDKEEYLKFTFAPPSVTEMSDEDPKREG